ncbi:MAG: rod shape-determining protein MreD [Ignavibacteria bacterium]|nr:rod shape-determining protein MreD [Ignavibacteria bacterium]
MNRYVRSALIVLGLLIIQTTFLPLISVEGVIPDVLLIWVIYNAVRRGQIEGMVAGFVVGLFQDFATTQFFGLAALSKTVTGFAGGFFFNENKTAVTLGTYRFVVIVAVLSLLHNLIYFGVLLQGMETTSLFSISSWSSTTMVYTAIISLLPMFAFSRKPTS